MDSVDNRIVSMRFDNKQFQNGVSDTIKAIDKLEDKLSFKGVKDGFGKIASSVKDISFSNVSRGIDTVVAKIPLMDKVWDQTVRAMTMKTISFVDNLVQQFGIVQSISAGFQEYETQMNAVQTILANTSSKGTTLDQVNEALDTLNTYADKTIYNFTEMTRNIGTFTAAGIDLDTAVNAIQGIANLAAVSGSNSQQASTAMYQLSQALAAGTVKLQDWNSVVNAGMGGQILQDELKRTAKAMGIDVDSIIESSGSFRESLSKGWVTSEVLTETLSHFTMSMADMTAEQANAAKASLQAKGYTDEEIQSIFELGETATDAATKVKTFTQLVDTLKESLQSGWTQTWEFIIGDFEEAKSMWTSISDTIQGMIQPSVDARNNMLQDWATLGDLDEEEVKRMEDAVKHQKQINDAAKDIWKNGDKAGMSRNEYLKSIGLDPEEVQAQIDKLAQGIDIDAEDISKDFDRIISGRDMVIEGFKNIWKNITRALNVIKGAWKDVFPPQTANNLINMSRRFRDWTETIYLSTDKLHDLHSIFRGIFSVFNIGKNLFKLATRAVKGFLDALFGDIDWSKLLARFGDWLFGLNQTVEKSNSLADIAYKVGNVVGTVVKGVVKAIGGVIALLVELADALGLKDKIVETADKVKEFIKTFDFEAAKERVSDFISHIKDKFIALKNGDISLKDFVSNVKDEAGKVTEAGGPFDDLKDYISDWMDGWKTFTVAPLQGFVDSVSHVFGSIDIGYIKDIWEDVKEIFKNIMDGFTNISDDFEGWTKKANFDDEVSLAGKGSAIYTLFSIGRSISKLGDLFGNSAETMAKVGKTFKTLSNLINTFSGRIRANNVLKLAIAIGIITASVITLTTFAVVDENGIVRSLVAIGIVLGSMIAVSFVIKSLIKAAKDIDNPKTIGNIAKVFMSMGVSLLLIFTVIKQLIAFFEAGDLKTQGALFIAAFTAVMSVFAMMSLLAAYLSKNKAQLAGVGTTMVMLAASVFIVMKAMEKIINDVQWLGDTGDILRAWRDVMFTMLAMAGIMAGMVKFMGGKAEGMIGVATSFVSLALAVKMIIGSVVTLALFDSKVDVKGAVSQVIKMMAWMGGILLALTLASKGFNIGSGVNHKFDTSAASLKGVASAFITMGIAINMMMVPILMFAYLNEKKMMKGIGMLVSIMLATSAALMIIARSHVSQGRIMNPVKTAAAFMMVAGTAIVLVKLLKNIKNIDSVVIGVSMISLLVVAVAGAIGVLATATKDDNNALQTAISMGLVVGALSLLVASMSALAKYNWKSITAAGLSLTVFIGVMSTMVGVLADTSDKSKVTAAAGVLSVLTLSLSPLMYALSALAKNKKSNIAAAATALTGVGVILGIMVGVLGKLMKGTDTANLAIISVAFIGMAAGILLMAKALRDLAGVKDGLAEAIAGLTTFMAIIIILTAALAGVGMATGGTFTAALLLSSAAILIFGAGVALICYGISELIDSLIEAKEHNIDWTDSFGPLATALGGTITLVAELLSNILALPGAISDAINAYHDLKDAQAEADSSRDRRQTGQLQDVKSGSQAYQDSAKERMKAMNDIAKKYDKQGDYNTSGAYDRAIQTEQGVARGVRDYYDDAIKKDYEYNRELAANLREMKTAYDELYETGGLGKDDVNMQKEIWGEDFYNPFEDKAWSNEVEKILKTRGMSWGGVFGDGLATGVTSALDIHSPSKVFEWIGEMLMKGLSNGISGGAGGVFDSFADLGSGGAGSFMDMFDLSSLTDKLTGQLDISSVTDNLNSAMSGIDMSQYTNGLQSQMNIPSMTGDMSSLFNTDSMTSGINMPNTNFESMFNTDGLATGDLSSIFGGMDTQIGDQASSLFGQMQLAQMQNPEVYNDSSIQSKMDTLISEMQLYNENSNNMSVILDSGALVGQLSGGIDKELGAQSVYKRRS